MSPEAPFFHPRFGPSLYKYYGVSSAYSLQAFEELIVRNRVYFPSIHSFNDPFDCQIDPDFTATHEQKRQFVTDMVQSTPSIGNNVSIQERIEKTLRFCEGPEGDKRLRESIDKTASRYGVLSLSEDPLSVPMWSYYAEDHKGLCFWFDWNERDVSKFQLVRMRCANGWNVDARRFARDANHFRKV
jgi:hypothetical protein